MNSTTKLTKKQWEMIQLERKANLIKLHAKHQDTFIDILPFLFTMQKYERQLQRLAEMSCNGYPKPVIEHRDGKTFSYNVEDQALRLKCEKREAKIEEAVKAYAAQFNLSVDFQGDPRGLMFQLITANGDAIAVA